MVPSGQQNPHEKHENMFMPYFNHCLLVVSKLMLRKQQKTGMY